MISKKKLDQLVAQFRGEQDADSYEQRRADWWGRKFQRSAGTGNFQTMKYRFFAERENAFEAFKKGLIDLYPIYTARLWMHETKGEKFAKNWIVKQKIYNHNPIGFQGFAVRP